MYLFVIEQVTAEVEISQCLGALQRFSERATVGEFHPKQRAVVVHAHVHHPVRERQGRQAAEHGKTIAPDPLATECPLNVRSMFPERALNLPGKFACRQKPKFRQNPTGARPVIPTYEVSDAKGEFHTDIVNKVTLQWGDCQQRFLLYFVSLIIGRPPVHNWLPRIRMENGKCGKSRTWPCCRTASAGRDERAAARWRCPSRTFC